MAIANYTDLKASIADFLARSDLTLKASDFIVLAEARLNRALRAVEMQATASSTLASGAVAIPADYLEWISARWVGARTQDLAFAEPDSPEWRFRYRPNGDPQMFTILAGNIEVRPIVAGDVKLYYYQKIAALSDSVATNWLITKAPDLYLYTSLAEAHIYMKDEARAGEFLALAQTEAQKATIAADANKFKLNPSRQVDTGVGAIRAVGGSMMPMPMPVGSA